MPDEPTPSPEEPASSSHSGGETLIRKLKHLFGHRQTSSSLRESLAGALDEADGVATDPFSAKERSMLRNVLGLRDLRVDDVMVPRADIDAVETDVPIAELIREFRDAGHSRLPVYKETLDEPCGMIHIKDLLGWMTERALLSQDGASADEAGKSGDLDMSRIPLKTSLAEAELVRQVLYVPPSMPAVDLLVKMQATWPLSSMNTAAPTVSSRSRIWSRKSSARSRTSTTRRRRR